VVTRVLVCGPSGCGKTTFSLRLAAAMGLDESAVRHGDDLITSHSWSGASAAMVSWIESPGPWCIESVSVVRALRKWLAVHPGDEKPCEVLYMLTRPYAVWEPGHRAMAKGHATIWSGIEAEVRRRGVNVRESLDDMPGL
jgi:energy-coupling factor transporter ATP-binding protein EcfA2